MAGCLRRLPAEAQLLRSGGRYRAGRHRPADAVRASRGQGRGDAIRPRTGCSVQGANIRMLGRRGACPKGQLLQVYERDAEYLSKRQRQDSGPEIHLRPSRGRVRGAGYELALACNHIMLTDDSVRPRWRCLRCRFWRCCREPGGLTRVTDKRRRCGATSPMSSARWKRVCGASAPRTGSLVDEVIPNSKFDATVAEPGPRIRRAASDEAGRCATGIALTPLDRTVSATPALLTPRSRSRSTGPRRIVTITIHGPEDADPAGSGDALVARGRRVLDAALPRANSMTRSCHLAAERTRCGAFGVPDAGRPVEKVLAHEAALLNANADHWLANEILQYWKRVLKRVDHDLALDGGACGTWVLLRRSLG